jgi:hypothetical protein
MYVLKPLTINSRLFNGKDENIYEREELRKGKSD